MAWSREDELSARDRLTITIATLFSAGLYHSQLKARLKPGRVHGVTEHKAARDCDTAGLLLWTAQGFKHLPLTEKIWADEGWTQRLR